MNLEGFVERMKEDNELVLKLRELFAREYEKNADSYNKDDFQRIMDSNEDWNCWRYLNHFQYDLDKSFENMKSNLKWRHEFNTSEAQICDFAKELWLFSPLVCAGEDKEGNLVVHFRGCLTYKPSPSIEEYYYQFLFYVVDSLDRQLCITKKILLVFDQTNSVLANVDLNLARWSVSVRNSLPSRLESILILGIPFLLKPIVNMIISWLPKEFRNLVFCGSRKELLDSRVDEHQQLEYSGGQLVEAHYRIAPLGSKWFKDIKKFQDEKIQDDFNNWIEKMVRSEHRQSMIDLQEKFDLKHGV